MDKIIEILNFLDKNNYIKISITNDDNINIDNIYNLFINNIVFESMHENPIELLCLGIYYEIKKDYENRFAAKKYLLMAIKLNNADAMIALGYYYKKIKDYENRSAAKKF